MVGFTIIAEKFINVSINGARKETIKLLQKQHNIK